MNLKSMRYNDKDRIYFSDAMNQIDEFTEYNEYSEINSSDYFKESLYNAEEEVDKMMASPLMNDYKKLKNKKISGSLLKKNKEYILKKIKWLNERSKKPKSIETNKKQVNINTMMKRLKKINKNISIKNFEESGESKKQLNIKKDNNITLPTINLLHTYNNNDKNNNKENVLKLISTDRKIINDDKKNISLTSGNVSKSLSMSRKILNNRNNDINNNDNKSFYFTQKRSKDSKFFSTKNKANNCSNKNTLDNMYKSCIKGLKTLELFENNESQKILSMNSYKDNKSKDFGDKYYNNDQIMKTFLFENISELNRNKYNKQQQIMKDYAQLKLKKDPIFKLSEKFAYFNRKPLLSLFNCDNNVEKYTMSPLAKLKIKDKNIMMKLEEDNRNKNLLLKRLDENQTKYTKGGYFIMTKEKDKDKDKDNKNKKFKIIKVDTNYNIGYDNEFFNSIKRLEPYENEQNDFLNNN